MAKFYSNLTGMFEDTKDIKAKYNEYLRSVKTPEVSYSTFLEENLISLQPVNRCEALTDEKYGMKEDLFDRLAPVVEEWADDVRLDKCETLEDSEVIDAMHEFVIRLLEAFSHLCNDHDGTW